MISELYEELSKFAQDKYADIVTDIRIIHSDTGRARKLRLFIVGGTVIDIRYSMENEYSYHWEYDSKRKIIYRHDNSPHRRWKKIKTFPKHFHNGSELSKDCIESYLSDIPKDALGEFLEFVKKKLLNIE